MTESMAKAGSAIASFMIAYAMFHKFFPANILNQISHYVNKIASIFYPYITIKIFEYQEGNLVRSKAYTTIQRYLNTNSIKQAKRLHATVINNFNTIVLSMGFHEQVVDEYEGVKFWWASYQVTPNGQTVSLQPREDKRRYYKLTCHKRYREIITKSYLNYVLKEGKNIISNQRQRKLYTNSKSAGGSSRNMWTHVLFKHTATFDTLAMDPTKKQEIMDDLVAFTKSKDYYSRIGKAWKRGYLLYGPPGTGKSTLIAAMANLLNYDIYDLELTSVKDNTKLRKLLIDTSGKSIFVVEDIDCSLNLTGQRNNKNDTDTDTKESDESEEKISKVNKKSSSKVTLSGLLNFIDGLWSACTGEKIFVFTTNYVDKLDPALVRRGRMDKHIEMSYCGFEAFEVLAKNYLGIHEHELFAKVRSLLEEVDITPADVAENLMPKSSGDDKESCLRRLVKALKKAKKQEKFK